MQTHVQHRNDGIKGWIVESTFEQPLVSNILHWYGFLNSDTNLRLFLLYCIYISIIV